MAIWTMPGDRVFQNEDSTKYVRRFGMSSMTDAVNLPLNVAAGSTAFSVGESAVLMFDPETTEWRQI